MMGLLLNPKAWATVVVLTALAASHWKAYVVGKNTERVATLEAAQAAIVQARVEEKENAKRIQDAQSSQIKALAAKAVDAERATVERDRLRDEIRTFSEGTAFASPSSFRAHRLGELLAACAAEYQSLGTSAESARVDLIATRDAWPK